MKFDKHWVEQRLADDQRLNRLQRSDLLDSAPEEAFDRATRLAASLLRVPVALVSLIDDRRQFFKSQSGLQDPWASLRQTRLSHSFCKYLVANGEPLVVEDAHQHAVLRENPAVEDLKIRAYAGIPLITADRHAIGVLCVIDSQPHEFSPDDLRLLRELAESVTAEIDLRLASAALERSEARFRAIFQHSPIAVFVLRDRAGTIHQTNPKAVELLGHSLDRLVDSPLGHYLHPQDRDPDWLEAVLTGETDVVKGEARFIRDDGKVLWGRISLSLIQDPESQVLAVAMVEDITAQKEAAEELKALSLRDELTGLFNRRALMTLGEQMLRLAARHGGCTILLFFDIDGLKEVNDSLGHDVGDRLIVEFAHLLLKMFRQADVVARLGGDEMVVLAHEVHTTGCDCMLERFYRNVEARNAVGDLPFKLSASVGHAIFSAEHPKTMEELLRDADSAMYEQKRQRKRTQPSIAVR